MTESSTPRAAAAPFSPALSPTPPAPSAAPPPNSPSPPPNQARPLFERSVGRKSAAPSAILRPRWITKSLKERTPVSRKLRAAVAQLGPIHLADSRAAVVQRLIALLREAHGTGARFVVFPELALTTFFPRWWMTEQDEIDRYFERDMPSAETRPLFDLARELGIGFYLGYAELTGEN